MVATASRPVKLVEASRFHVVDKWIPDELKYRMHDWQPKSRMGEIVQQCLAFLPAELAGEVIERITSCLILESSLRWEEFYQPDSPARHGGPLYEDRGIVSRKKVTTAGVTRLCVDWANAIFDMKYMALGTLATAESNAHTNMQTEIIASHYTGGVRVTCTHAESTNTVPVVGTHTQATAGDTIEEHGIFNSATQGAVTLWDRHLTGTTVLAVADGITATYTLTASAEA